MKLKGSPWVLLFILLHVSSLSPGAELHGDAFTLDASYKAELAANLAGGLKRGTSFLGLADLGVELHSEGLGWWKGTCLHLSGQASHGGRPSASLIGDLQVASNIEAGSHVYLGEAWIRQDWGQFSLQTGLMDLNADYSVCEEACAFLHSSFGTQAILAINAGAPVFPLTGLALNVQWQCRDLFTWQAGIYEGAVTPFEDGNPFNLKHRLSKREGYLLISELQTGLQHAKIKIGGHGHTGLRNWGIHLNSIQALWTGKNRCVGIFEMLALSPKRKEELTCNLAGGICWRGVLSKKGKDMLGLGATSVHRYEQGWETAIEFCYRIELWNHLSFTPDLQYIVHPGTTKKTSNSLVFFTRLEVSY